MGVRGLALPLLFGDHESVAAQKPERKRRTREHVIADLSANHVERLALAHSYSVEQTRHDYGIDLLIFTYSDKGYMENGHIEVQLKATESLKLRRGGRDVAFPVDLRDWNHWIGQPMPVILVVYDASESRGYWAHIQGYFNAGAFKIRKGAGSTTLRLLVRRTVTHKALRRFARLKEEALADARKGTGRA